MIDEFDLDQDGEISEAEFVSYVPIMGVYPLVYLTFDDRLR